MAFTCNDCSLVWTLPKRFCPRCKSRNFRNGSAPFSPGHDFSAADDGQAQTVLSPTTEQTDDEE